jgi:hypothetical protein
MAYHRKCNRCGKVVTCKVSRHKIEGSHVSVVKLTCPTCGRRLADVYS